MTACVVLAAETAAIFGYLVYVAPLMPDCIPQTAMLCTLVLISYYLHYRCLAALIPLLWSASGLQSHNIYLEGSLKAQCMVSGKKRGSRACTSVCGCTRMFAVQCNALWHEDVSCNAGRRHVIQATCRGRARHRQHGVLSLTAIRGWAWVHALPAALTGPCAQSTVLCATGKIRKRDVSTPWLRI